MECVRFASALFILSEKERERKMKKALLLLITLLLALALCACSNTPSGGNSGNGGEGGNSGEGFDPNRVSFTSAYNRAKNLGFEGTLDEFIELISGKDGADGKDGVSVVSVQVNEDGKLIVQLSDNTTVDCGKVVGKDGKDGKDGVTPTIEISEDGYWVINGEKTEYKAEGKDGADGSTPLIKISPDGYWVINGVKTEYKAVGSDGKDGADGEDGKDGEDGFTPTVEISEDGYWVINGVKTEHKAVGSDGNGDGVPAIEISSDGYWIINGEKTEHKAIGKDGEDGKNGATIAKVEFDELGRLVITLTDGTVLDPVEIPEKEAHVHSYGEWIDFPGNRLEICENRLYYRACSLCDVKDFKIGSHSDHSFNTVTTPPTCTEKGYDTITCTLCGKVEIANEVAALGHSFDNVVTTPPTCTEKGYDTITCTLCGKVEIANEVVALGHSPKDSYSGNDTYHWHECNNCDAKFEYAKHALNVNYRCTICDAQLATPTEGIVYEISDDGSYATVVGYEGTSQDVVIASEYQGVPVQSVGAEAFAGRDFITSLTIPNSVTSIGYGAFVECHSLTSVTIPASVLNIDFTAFVACIKLAEITVDEANSTYKSVDGNLYTKDGKMLVQYAAGKSDTSFVIPNSVTSIGDYAFCYCTSFTSVTIPNSVETVGEGAFAICSNLSELTLGNSLTSIGDSAFYNCDDLTSVTIPNSVTSIGDSAFCDCSNLTSVTIGNGVTNIGDRAFSDCYKLVEVINKSSLNITCGSYDYGYVAKYAIEVHQGESKVVTSDNYLFYICEDVNYLFGYVGNETELSLPESYNGEEYEICDYAFYNCSTLTSVTIPDRVETIGERAFESCYYLSELALSNSLTSIGDYAFYNCDDLTSVTIPDSVETIGEYAFASCSNLSELTLGNSLTSIGDYAFYNCDGLTSVTIPDSVTSIGCGTFRGCSKLVDIKVDEANSTYKSVDGNLYTKDGKMLVQYAAGKSDTSFAIPNSVTSIGMDAFYNCSNLMSVTIPDSVTSIGCGAFRGCSKLVDIKVDEANSNYKSINGNLYSKDGKTLVQYAAGKSDTSFAIPYSVTAIGDYAFYRCDNLMSVTILNSVETIGEWAFAYCFNLSKLTLGNSLTSIGDYAFYNCDDLTSVTIPDSVETIGIYAFYSCNNLSKLTLGNSLTSIGNSAFEYCSSLTSVTIPDSVTSIGDSAFRDCSSLTSVTIGNGVPNIGSGAFSDCYKLVEVINRSSLNITCGSYDYGCVAKYAIEVHQGESKVVTSNNYLFYICEDVNYLFGYVGNETELYLPESYNGEEYEIYKYAFYNCFSLTGVAIPDSVTSIGDYAFYNCDNLTSVTFENPEGWWYSYGASDTSGTSISSSELSDAAKAAELLGSTYYNYYWKRG